MVRRADGVVSDLVDGCAFLIGPAGTHIVELNPTGTVVWDALAVDRDVDRVVDVVAETFSAKSAAREQIHRDVVAFLEELSQLGLTTG